MQKRKHSATEEAVEKMTKKPSSTMPKIPRRVAKVDPQNCRKRLTLLEVKSKKQKTAQQKSDLAKSQHFPVYNEEPYF